MWSPKDEVEVVSALASGDLEETPSFDGKAALPPPGKNAALATDIAAMSLEGGVLVYGIAEDSHKRLTVPAPFPLAGAAERIDQVAQTGIAEPPFIRIRAIASSGTPGTGFLVVEVPASPRAPHMVTLGGLNQFYGRGATGNRRLTEGEIARYYERRQRWEIDRNQWLAEHLERSAERFEPDPSLVFMHAFARPVAVNEGMLERPDEQEILAAIAQAAEATERSIWDPDIAHASGWARAGADAWVLSTRPSSAVVKKQAEVRVEMNGDAWFFSGRVGDTMESGQLCVFETAIRGNLTRFLAMMGELYARTGYGGPVDVGVAVTGLDGAASHEAMISSGWVHPYHAADYRRTAHVAADQLACDRAAVIDQLVRRLLRALNPQARQP
jgi:hypothetical protein